MIEGKVVKSTGSWYNVLLDSGKLIPCRIQGKFRLNGLKLTNPVAVGDDVIIELENIEEASGIITKILPRKNYVVRQSPRKKHNVHFLASNVDQAALVMTVVEPKLKQGFIDRFLIMTEPYNIPVIIIFNKSDLYEEADLLMFNYLKEVYENIGYKVLLTSTESGEGISTLQELLVNKTTLMGGQSGVGKSTIINRMEPALELRTGELSDYTGKGQHTTTFAEMILLKSGGRIIDTPGIKTLAFNHLEVMDVAHNFREFFVLSETCKFSNCMHRNEPHCAVKDALEKGEVSELRYINYIQIIEEIEDQNYWERHTDI